MVIKNKKKPHSTGFELISGRLNLVFTIFSTRHGSRFQRACPHWCKFDSKQSTPTRKSPTCPTSTTFQSGTSSQWTTSVRAKYPIRWILDPPGIYHRILPLPDPPFLRKRSRFPQESMSFGTPLNSAAVLKTTLPYAAVIVGICVSIAKYCLQLLPTVAHEEIPQVDTKRIVPSIEILRRFNGIDC